MILNHDNSLTKKSRLAAMAIFLFFLLCPMAGAMDSVLMGGSLDPMQTGTASEVMRTVIGGGTWAAERYQVMPVNGTIKDLRVKLNSALASGSYTFTLRVNGADSTLTCQVTSQTCVDTDHDVSVSAGDRVSLEYLAATPNEAKTATWSMILSAGDNESVLMGSTNATVSGALFLTVNGAASNDGTESDAQSVMPTAGTISNLYVVTNDSPGAGTSFTFTLKLNGSDTALTCTIANTTTSCNDPTNSFNIVAGDLVVMSVTVSGVPTGRYMYFGMKFSPTINGESIQTVSEDDDAANNEYMTLNNDFSVGAWTATEANTYELASNGVVFKKLRVRLETAPDSTPDATSDDRTFTLSQNGTPTALTCTISENSTTCNDPTNTVTASTFDWMTTKHTLANTPAASTGISIGYVTYIDPGGTPAATRRVILIQ